MHYWYWDAQMCLWCFHTKGIIQNNICNSRICPSLSYDGHTLLVVPANSLGLRRLMQEVFGFKLSNPLVNA